MPPRKMTRPVSTKPAPEALSRAPPKHGNNPTKKRVASRERVPSPPLKRTKVREPNGLLPDAQHALAPKQKPFFIPLPAAPERTRPCLQLFVWGAGNFGQFGMGPDNSGEFSKPKKNTWVDAKIQTHGFGENFGGLESVAAGGLHTMFIDENGVVWTCGVNDDAALGRVTQNVPDPESPNTFLDVDELSAVPHPLQSLIDENFRAVKVAAGDSISAAVSTEGELRVWGSFRANEGALGFSSGNQRQFLPVPILELSQKPGNSERVVSVASGNDHLLVLTSLGNIFTWGVGEKSQLGRKIIERRKMHGTVPEKITLGSRSRKAVVVGAGHYHSFAVDDSGDVWGWGLNSMGQTGTGYTFPSDSEVFLPKRVIGLSKTELGGETVVEIVGGDHHSLFRTSGGKVYACGRWNAGQLGLPADHPIFEGDTNPDFIPEPVRVPFPDEDDPIVQISAGAHNNSAVTKGGALYAWGQGTQSELGVGDESEVRTPRLIVRREGGSWTAVAVACGGQHTLGLFRKKL